MKRLCILLLALVSMVGFSQTKNFIDQPYIEVTGMAEMEIVPNEIYLKILLNEADYKGKASVEEKERSMIQQLESIGIATSKDLVVQDIASNFKFYLLKSTAIMAVKQYQLKVSDALTAARVLKNLEELEISNVSIERVDHSDLEKYKAEVKVMAIKAAKTKADYLSEAIGQTCGKAIYIQEIENRIYDDLSGMAGGMNANIKIRGVSSLEAEPDIEFEKIKLESTIIVMFNLN